MDMDLARDFVRANQEAKEHEKIAKTYRAERELLGEMLLEQMAQDGVSKVTVDGATIYIHTQLWANAAIEEGSGLRNFGQACEALIECGFPELVETKFSTQRVSSLIRELDETEGGIPDRLRETLDITEKMSCRVRSGGAK